METDPSAPQPKNGDPQGLVPRGQVASQRCLAHTSSGRPCKRWAIVGGTVCPTHGGSAPQVREAARRRILEFAPLALQVLQDIATDPEAGEASRVRAAIDLLDRAGLKVAEELAVIPQEATNAALDEAIATALAARALMPRYGDQVEDIDEADEA